MAFLNQDEDQNQPTAPSTMPSATSPAPASSPIASPQTMANAPKGSGRFTNIQKYIGANQGAGQRLASGVEKRVQSQVNPNVEKAQSQASQIAEQVNKAQGTLGQGQALQSQVANQNFDAQAFAAQEPNVQQFTQFRTGQAIDENALRSQAEQAQQQAMQAQQQAQGFSQQLGTEQGRQQLLKQTFSPSRNYSIGQQRLDNLFLQQASPQLQDLSKNLNLTQQQLGNLGSQADQKRQAIQDLAGQEQELAQGLTSAIGAREQDVVSAAEARANEVNQARMSEQEKARQQYQNLVEGKGIEKSFADNLGLTEQDRLFNVLKNQGNVDDYLKFNPTLLQGANQLASQEQRQKYDAIARLAGIDPNQRRINQQSDAPAAVESTGQLRSRIDENKNKFEDLVKDYSYTSKGDIGSNFISGYSTQNLRDLIPYAENELKTAGNIGSNDFYMRNLYGGKEQFGSINDVINNLNSQTSVQSPMSGLYRTNQYGGSMGQSITNTAKLQALKDAYAKLSDEGYYQRANIIDPTLVRLPEPT